MTSTRLPISAYVICFNEADYIENCIRSLKPCSEIIVVDSGSTDGTLELLERLQAEGFPLTIVDQPWLGYAGQKQRALDLCTESWCLNLDADERLDRDLRAELPQLIAAPAEIEAWRIVRRPYLIGHGYVPRGTGDRSHPRLARKGAASYDLSLKVHESLRVSGQVALANRGGILHYRPLPIDEQIVKEAKYATLKAQHKYASGKRSNLLRLVFSPFVWLFRFYFRYRLYRYGSSGLIQAGTSAIYAFLTEAKMLQLEAAERRPDRDEPRLRAP
ncbi:MAG: glycosyltransferase family 2 protein [Ancalomicrobiaceae bacterium]|nr:glycosyltransferase family 2 protein [Ancalomicrobiaceae bacterium]